VWLCSSFEKDSRCCSLPSQPAASLSFLFIHAHVNSSVVVLCFECAKLTATQTDPRELEPPPSRPADSPVSLLTGVTTDPRLAAWSCFSEAPEAVLTAPSPFDPASDVTLCRFLRARNYDVDSAETMLREYLEHRETWRVAEILAQPDPLEQMWQRYAPLMFCGHDRLGRPVLIERSGEVRVGKLMQHLTMQDFFFRHCRHSKRRRRRKKKKKKREGRRKIQHAIAWLKMLPPSRLCAVEIVERVIDMAAKRFGSHVSQVMRRGKGNEHDAPF
jgi:hypothetical protein